MGKARFSLSSLCLMTLSLGACVPVVRTVPSREARVVVVDRDDEDRSELRVPPGHYPKPGQCRVWFPGRPPGHQPRAGSCAAVERTAPAGSWILYRPTSDKRVVHARVIDPKRDGVVVVVRIYDADHGTYIGRERPR
jgi:hypothetical protein